MKLRGKFLVLINYIEGFNNYILGIIFILYT